MTTIAFTPSASAAPPFQTTVTLDGTAYSLVTTWNFYRGGDNGEGDGWYYSLTDQSGTLIVNAPLIGSPPDADILLAPGLFVTSTLLYRADTGLFEVGP